MKKKLMVLSIMMLSTLTSLKAQTSTDEITIEFFKLYSKSPTKAVQYVFSTNQWLVDRKKDEVENVKNQLNNFIGLVGDYYGYETITEKSIGQSYKLISYMIKYDRQPVRFTFVFYKPKDIWQVQNFQYDDNLSDELEEAGKVYRLKENWE